MKMQLIICQKLIGTYSAVDQLGDLHYKYYDFEPNNPNMIFGNDVTIDFIKGTVTTTKEEDTITYPLLDLLTI